MRFQQKQKQEREQKKSDMIGGRSLDAIDPNDINNRVQIRDGKVCGIFLLSIF